MLNITQINNLTTLETSFIDPVTKKKNTAINKINKEASGKEQPSSKKISNRKIETTIINRIFGENKSNSR